VTSAVSPTALFTRAAVELRRQILSVAAERRLDPATEVLAHIGVALLDQATLLVAEVRRVADALENHWA